MNIPQIVFRYSGIYDKQWRELYDFQYKERLKEDPGTKHTYPTREEILAYITQVGSVWKKEEQRILTEMSTITSLGWDEKEVVCYVVGRKVPFSDPLTMTVYSHRPLDYFIDQLTHELIHNLFIQKKNYARMKKCWEYIHETYKNESLTSRYHIPLHAVHSQIYLNLFGEDRLKRDIGSMIVEDHKKSWAIVQKERDKHILEEFLKRIDRT